MLALVLAAQVPTASFPGSGFRDEDLVRAGTLHAAREVVELPGTLVGRFGRVLAARGDADGDGRPELLASDDGGARELELGTNGRAQTLAPFALPFQPDSMAVIGDVDGNGHDDLALGKRGSLGTVGEVRVLLLGANGAILSTQVLTGGNAASFGASVAALGDVDGDGVPDLAAGIPEAFGFSPELVELGRYRVFFLNADGSARAYTVNHGGLGFALDPNVIGAALAGIGDFDGDGVPDLAVGRPRADTVELHLLNPDGSQASSIPIQQPDAGHFGASLAALGDLDANGVSDLAIGSPGSAGASLWTLRLPSLALRRIPRSALGAADGQRVDEFARALAGVGDVNGDGRADVAVGDPGRGTGAVWTVFLASNGARVGSAETSGLAGPIAGGPAPGDDHGQALAPLGDLDGDGLLDFASGAPGTDAVGAADSGAVFANFLAAGGGVRAASKVSGTFGSFGGALAPGAGFGHALAWLGADALAVGAPGAPGGGELWLLELAPSGTVAAETRIAAGIGGFGGALAPGDRFGAALARLGDLDGDGLEEHAVGAPGDDQSATNAGAVWILSLDVNRVVQAETKLAPETSPGAAFGSALACAGDLDGDGVPDLFAGAPRALAETGKVWVLFLNGDGTLKGSLELTAAALSPGTLASLDLFGSALAVLPDLNGDGRDELAVGAPGDGPGALHVLFFAPDGSVRAHRRLGPQLALGFQDGFGGALAHVGDHDGDGLPDLAAGAPDPFDTAQPGALWLLDLEGLACVDFEREHDLVTPMVDGQAVSSPDEFGNRLTLAGAGANLGPALFDSSVGGPNDPGPAPDFLVGRGHVLLLQSTLAPGRTEPDVFDQPEPDADGGTLTFDFAAPVRLHSVDLIDVDLGPAEGATLVLVDAAARTRTYSVPAGWTEDRVLDGPPGWRTLDLRRLAPQPGFAATATAAQVRGFDARAVTRLEVHLAGSAALDALRYRPRP